MGKFDNFEINVEEPTKREITTINNETKETTTEETNNINNNILVETINNNFLDPLMKKAKKPQKEFVNFKLEPSTIDCLITLAMQNNLTLTETIETILQGYIELHNVKASKRLIEQFKEKNAKKGRRNKQKNS